MCAAARRITALAVALVLGGPASLPCCRAAETSSAAFWRSLEPGLDLARFSTEDTTAHGEGDLFVLRVDPAHWSLRLLSAAELEAPRNRDVRDWCAEFGLVAAINAGMYQADRRTHVGYLQRDGRVENPRANGYLSALAYGPRSAQQPPLRIFDLDVNPLETITSEYANVVQNLRLVKRPRESRWHRRDRAWREAALGEDSAGRALLIFCRSALTMPDFNALLLKLPIDLQVAQHLEGGAEAQFHVAHPAVADDFRATKRRWMSWPIPNVLGVVRKTGSLAD